MLTTKWFQGSPFNDQCPRGSYAGADGRYPAGCVTIALAQIIAYHNSPRATSFLNYGAPDWRTLREHDFSVRNDSLHSATMRLYIAGIMSRIGHDIPVDYGFGWSDAAFATPAAARRYLEKIRYRGTDKHNDYEEHLVFRMLRSERPVFMGAISCLVDGHAWVIDGILQNQRRAYKFINGIPVDTLTGLSPKMAHCNWGWGEERCNGYYVSGIFNLKNGPIEIEPGLDDGGRVDYDPGKKNVDFDWHFRMVTYDKP